MSGDDVEGCGRRDLVARGLAALGVLGALNVSTVPVLAKDYSSRREAFDEMDRLAAICGMRLGAVRRARKEAEPLCSRFLASLDRYRKTREDFRRRFGLPTGLEPASQLGEVDADLAGLRQALDDLMVAYAESLPVFANAEAVSRLAVDMVDVSRLRTVIDLWAGTDGA